jgi:hypothetical protein
MYSPSGVRTTLLGGWLHTATAVAVDEEEGEEGEVLLCW